MRRKMKNDGNKIKYVPKIRFCIGNSDSYLLQSNEVLQL
jgi:hypothetical protein